MVVCGWCTDLGLHHLPLLFPLLSPNSRGLCQAIAAALAGHRAQLSHIPGGRPASEGSQLPTCAFFYASLSACLPVCIFVPESGPVCLLSCLDSSSPGACSFKQTKICLSLKTTTHVILVLAFSNSRKDCPQIM